MKSYDIYAKELCNTSWKKPVIKQLHAYFTGLDMEFYTGYFQASAYGKNQ